MTDEQGLTVTSMLRTPDPHALPNCQRCHGVGRVRTGTAINQIALCSCVIARRRMEAAERRIERTLPSKMQEMTLETFQTGDLSRNVRAKKVARRFVEHYDDARAEGWMLGFWGVPGAGKTHLAVGTARACAKRYNIRFEVINFPKMLHEVRERWNKPKGQTGRSPLELAMNTDLLVLDDFGAHYDANPDREQVSWVMEQLYMLLDERIMENRPTLYTMNMQPSTLEAQLDNEAGKRVLSRIQRAEVGAPIEVAVVEGTNRQSAESRRKLFG